MHRDATWAVGKEAAWGPFIGYNHMYKLPLASCRLESLAVSPMPYCLHNAIRAPGFLQVSRMSQSVAHHIEGHTLPPLVVLALKGAFLHREKNINDRGFVLNGY